MHVTTRAIVLREAAYKESDKILTLLTPDPRQDHRAGPRLPEEGQRALRRLPAAGVVGR